MNHPEVSSGSFQHAGNYSITIVPVDDSSYIGVGYFRSE